MSRIYFSLNGLYKFSVHDLHFTIILFISVRSAYLKGVGAQTSSYVVLKLQNVKSTTVAVRGSQPTWEQDFIL